MIQDKAQSEANGGKGYNAGLDYLARSLRARREAPARGVAALAKGAAIACEPRLALDRLPTRCIRNDQVDGVDHQRGVALATSLIMLSVMTLIGVAGMGNSVLEQRIAGNQKQRWQAMVLADSGLQHADSLLSAPCGAQTDFTAELQSNGGTLVASTSLGAGRYTVSLEDNAGDPDPNADVDGDGIVRLVATGEAGQSTNLSVVRLEQTVRRQLTERDYAVLTASDTLIEGAPTIGGCAAHVHSNGDVNLLGGGELDGNVSAAGAVSNSGGAVINGDTTSDALLITPPEIVATDLRDSADFLLTSSGTIEDTAGQTLHDGSGDWNGWDYSGGQWELSGDTPPDGVYYAHAGVLISGDPGASGGAWQVTIAARDDIQVTGQVTARSYSDDIRLSDVGDLLFVAGGDLQITALPNQTLTGALVAGQQVEIVGDLAIEGRIIAQGDDASTSLVDTNRLAGNLQINGQSALPSSATGGLVRLAWRERRN
jgi:Tfp pilus assembly protein PilX